MATRKLGPALAAGCTCVLKPATRDPAHRLRCSREILAEAGVPAGRRQRRHHLEGRADGQRDAARPAGPQALLHRLDRGRPACSSRRPPTRCSTARWSSAATRPSSSSTTPTSTPALDGAMVAKMRNGGEACTAANRFYVQRRIAEAFAARLAGRMARCRSGPATIPRPSSARWSTPRPSPRSARSSTTRSTPARASCRRRAPRPAPASTIPPTVIDGVPTGARDHPRGNLRPGRGDRHLRRPRTRRSPLANDTEYGLVAYVYTGDLARGLRVSERIEAGMVGLNRGLVSDPAAPFGGVKQSGLGREGAHQASSSSARPSTSPPRGRPEPPPARRLTAESLAPKRARTRRSGGA